MIGDIRAPLNLIGDTRAPLNLIADIRAPLNLIADTRAPLNLIADTRTLTRAGLLVATSLVNPPPPIQKADPAKCQRVFYLLNFLKKT